MVDKSTYHSPMLARFIDYELRSSDRIGDIDLMIATQELRYERVPSMSYARVALL